MIIEIVHTIDSKENIISCIAITDGMDKIEKVYSCALQRYINEQKDLWEN